MRLIEGREAVKTRQESKFILPSHSWRNFSRFISNWFLTDGFYTDFNIVPSRCHHKSIDVVKRHVIIAKAHHLIAFFMLRRFSVENVSPRAFDVAGLIK